MLKLEIIPEVILAILFNTEIVPKVILAILVLFRAVFSDIHQPNLLHRPKITKSKHKIFTIDLSRETIMEAKLLEPANWNRDIDAPSPRLFCDCLPQCTIHTLFIK